MWPAASKDIYYLILYERSMPLRPPAPRIESDSATLGL